jgi:hypothetical protein
MKLKAIAASLLAGIGFIAILSSFTITPKPKVKPRIVNIVNFIRLLEPRDPAITEDVLYQTVVKQVEIMNKYQLRGTFLLQYDALMDARYQKLLKSLPADSFEIGAWWEIPQPMVEKAGLKWRAVTRGTGTPTSVSLPATHPKKGKSWPMFTCRILKAFSAITPNRLAPGL